MFYMLKKKKYILLMFQNITQIVKSKLFFLMIPNGETCKVKSEDREAESEGRQRRLWCYLAAKTFSVIKSNNV